MELTRKIARSSTWGSFRLTTPSSQAVETQPGVLLASAQTLALALVLSLIAGILQIGVSAYIAFAFTGAFVTHLMFRPERREIGFAILAGAGFGAFYVARHGTLQYFYGNMVAVPGAFFGMGTLFVLGTRWIWADPSAKWMRFERLRDAALVPFLCVGSMIAVAPAIGFTPLTYDRMLYIFDAKFGGPPAWIIGNAFSDHHWLRLACSYVYNSLPLGLAICLAFQWQDRQKRIWYPLDLRWLSITLGCIGFLLYQICPAAGPVYLFPNEFPHAVPNLATIIAAPGWVREVPRNGMPSLHVGWTMLLFWNMRHRAWWVVLAAGTYVTMTALATLGLGEHYLIDLIVAVPVALTLQALWLRTKSTLRLAAIGVGVAMTLGWLIALRTGAMISMPAGVWAWLVAGVTVGVPAMLAWRIEVGRTSRSAAGLQTGSP
jgi:hypothetical protein